MLLHLPSDSLPKLCSRPSRIHPHGNPKERIPSDSRASLQAVQHDIRVYSHSGHSNDLPSTFPRLTFPVDQNQRSRGWCITFQYAADILVRIHHRQ